jgi:hypothetical protein
MGRRLREEEVMTIQVLHERGCPNREIARKLGIDEKAVRYRLGRLARGAADGRSEKPFRAEGFEADPSLAGARVESPRGESAGAARAPGGRGIGSSVRPGSAGRLGLEGLRCLHEISYVVQRVQSPPGQG